MSSRRLQPWIEAAILAALALILDLLPSIRLGPWISISFAMVPVFLVAFRWEVKAGLLSGFLWGLLQVITGDFYYLQIIQFIVEYFIAFACVGLAGLFVRQIQNSFQNGQKGKGMVYIVIAIFVGSFARYIWHYIAGIVFWGSYAPKGMSPAYYSLTVNGPAWLGSFLLCAVVILILVSVSPKLLQVKR
jgi:thiamine transporter